MGRKLPNDDQGGRLDAEAKATKVSRACYFEDGSSLEGLLLLLTPAAVYRTCLPLDSAWELRTAVLIRRASWQLTGLISG